MRVHGAYVANNESKAKLTVRVNERSARPGSRSWLALLFIGISVLAWARNGDIIVWLLSHEIVGEAATRSLPGALRWVYVAIAILSLVAARRIATWSVAGISRWGPVQVVTAHVAMALRPLAKSL